MKEITLHAETSSGNNIVDESNPPWETSPYSLISWRDMEKFSAERFYRIARYFESVSRLHVNEPDKRIPADNETITKWFETVRTSLKDIGLRVSVLQIEKMMEKLRKGNLTHEKVQEMSAVLQDRIEDEMSLALFLHIPHKKADYHEQGKPLFGEEVQAAFPSSVYDIEEAGKAYALGRNTACVFHLQRVLEIGLKVLAKTLGCPFDRNSWDAHLKDIERELEKRYKSAGIRTPDELFYSEAASQFTHVKTAWRNPTMHIERAYSDEVAFDIFLATRAFVRHLSTRLKE